MAETLLNWAVMLFSLFALLFIAWTGFRDLQATAQPRSSASKSRVWMDEGSDSEPLTQNSRQNGVNGPGHCLSVEYRRDGRVAHLQTLPEDQPGYIGTEQMPMMGSGVLVRHLRVSHTGDGFALENRHSSQPVRWQASDGHTGDLLPGESLPVRGSVELALGDVQVVCHED